MGRGGGEEERRRGVEEKGWRGRGREERMRKYRIQEST